MLLVATEGLVRLVWVVAQVGAAETILDVGCAENPIWRNTACKVTTLDLSTRPAGGHDPEPCIPNIVGCAEALPFKDGGFDIVCLGDLLEHVDDTYLVLKEALRVAKKKVIITVPWEKKWRDNLKPFTNPFHKRYYTRYSFDKELGQFGLRFIAGALVNEGFSWLTGVIYHD